MIYLILVFLIAAAILAIMHVVQGKPLLWISVILLCIVEAMQVLPGVPHG